MMGLAGIIAQTPGELALRLNTLRGTATYSAYVVDASVFDATLTEVEDELRSMDAAAAMTRIAARGGERLVEEISAASAELLVADARGFSAEDWALLDQRRSSIAHRGVLVFVTTPASFAELMRHAPNLASWLGGEVFAYPAEDTDAAVREQRLTVLRAWASRADDDIVDAAAAGTLPRDPEYAEWLVLLGRGDLLGPDEG